MEWFNNISNKNQHRFVVFDIESFHSSISEDLFNEAFSFAKTKVNITDQEMSIITQSRNTLLFNKNQPWVKRSGNEEFDVPMGCFDGAELCETIGIYIMTKLQKVFQKDDARLYRDDGLGVMKELPGPEMERKRKQIIKIFKKLRLSITIKMNLHVVDFLNVQFNLKTNSYKAYMKPNTEPVYINKNSNHPPQVLKELPKTIEKRISNISSSKEIFDISKPIYEKTLNECEFQHKLLYQENLINNIDDNQEKKKRKRNIIWYNPPYSMNVTTNIGKLFFRLLQKHFPKTRKFYKIFNKNCVKLSYSSLRNIASII